MYSLYIILFVPSTLPDISTHRRITYFGKDYVEDKYGGLTQAPNNMDTVLDVGTEVAFYALEQYEEYPALLETHFGGSQRSSVILAAAGALTALITSAASQHHVSLWTVLTDLSTYGLSVNKKTMSKLVHLEGWMNRLNDMTRTAGVE